MQVGDKYFELLTVIVLLLCNNDKYLIVIV